jgi:glycosyltransferase involved in cell wall biosynthesis
VNAPRVSIIVPIYNTAQYLEECLTSISRQTYENLDVVLIDDGSTDESSVICNRFASLDKRFRYHYKPNGGLSSARNFGLNVVEGEFICFVDSDDYLDDNFVSAHLCALIKSKLDISVCGRYVIEKNFMRELFSRSKVSFWSSEEAVSRLLSWDSIDGAVCDKVFRKDLFESVRFPEGVFSEDLPVSMLLFCKVSSVVHIGKPLYFYRQRPGSLTSKALSSWVLTGLISVEHATRIALTTFPHLSHQARKFYFDYLLIFIGKALSEKSSNYDLFAHRSLKRLIREKVDIFFLIRIYSLYTVAKILAYAFLPIPILLVLQHSRSNISRYF